MTLRRRCRRAWRAWVHWLRPKAALPVRCPPCLPNLFAYHPLHHDTAADQDEALSVICGGVV